MKKTKKRSKVLEKIKKTKINLKNKNKHSKKNNTFVI